MIGICIIAFGIGVVIGTIYEMATWDEEAELKKIRFKQSKKNIKF